MDGRDEWASMYVTTQPHTHSLDEKKQCSLAVDSSLKDAMRPTTTGTSSSSSRSCFIIIRFTTMRHHKRPHSTMTAAAQDDDCCFAYGDEDARRHRPVTWTSIATKSIRNARSLTFFQHRLLCYCYCYCSCDTVLPSICHPSPTW